MEMLKRLFELLEMTSIFRKRFLVQQHLAEGKEDCTVWRKELIAAQHTVLSLIILEQYV